MCSVLTEWADKGDLQTFFNEHLQLKQYVDEEQLWVIFFQVYFYISQKKLLF